MFVDIMNVFIL